MAIRALGWAGLAAASGVASLILGLGLGAGAPPHPETVTAAPPPVGAPGMRETLVVVPGGDEAATYDGSGNIDFWRYRQGRWVLLRRSTYPVLPGAPGPGVPIVKGELLAGMTSATFIAYGAFTGDGSGNAIAFTNGPHGWGTVAPSPAGTLVPTGKRSTTNDTPGNTWEERFSDHQLVTENENPFFSNAQGGLYPLVTHWKWDKHLFVDAHDNAFTAARRAAPVASRTPLLGCPKTPANGTYQGYIQAVLPQTEKVDEPVELQIEESPAPPACTFEVGANTPMVVQAKTRTGRVEWVSAPTWLLTSDELSSLGNSPLTLYGTGRNEGPYYVPAALGLKTIVSDLGYPEYAGSTGGSDSTYGEVTVRAGSVTAVAMLPTPDE